MGTSVDKISGYRSGNADLIYPGEELTIGTPESDASSYANDVRNELDSTLDDAPEAEVDPISEYETELADYEGNRDSAFERLKGLTTEVFDREYKDRGLDKNKERISKLDTDISKLRQARDADLNEVRKNPNLSAAQMTGDVKKQADFYNNQINNLINERNSVATEYNAALDEVDRIVENEVGDAQLEYQYYSGLTDQTRGRMSEYEKTLREELMAEQEQENFEDQLDQALEIAMLRESSGGGGGSDSGNWRLMYDDFGEPLYWYNPDTQEIRRIEEGETPSGNGTDSYADIDTELDDTDEEGSEDTRGWWARLWNL